MVRKPVNLNDADQKMDFYWTSFGKQFQIELINYYRINEQWTIFIIKVLKTDHHKTNLVDHVMVNDIKIECNKGGNIMIHRFMNSSFNT